MAGLSKLEDITTLGLPGRTSREASGLENVPNRNFPIKRESSKLFFTVLPKKLNLWNWYTIHLERKPFRPRSRSRLNLGG